MIVQVRSRPCIARAGEVAFVEPSRFASAKLYGFVVDADPVRVHEVLTRYIGRPFPRPRPPCRRSWHQPGSRPVRVHRQRSTSGCNPRRSGASGRSEPTAAAGRRSAVQGIPA
jgi:hypothetical protein